MDANTIISVSAVIISIVSAIIAHSTTNVAKENLEIQKEHNKKSLLPIINLNTFDYENCIKIELRNDGVGPAIITNITVEKNVHERKNNIFDWMPTLPEDLSYSNYLIRYEKISIGQGNGIEMLTMKINKNDPGETAFRERLRGVLRELTVIIKYTDVYGTQFEYSRKLDWYARVNNC